MALRITSILPAMQWLPSVNVGTVRADALAGLSNAAIVLPQGVAFATIAGLPPEYGLYTAMITTIIAAMWGSSMVMISGPTTAISAVLFGTLVTMAVPMSNRFVELALLLTVLVGLFQIVAGAARLGGLVTFVSHSVLTAFTAAAAILIGVSQIGGALGIDMEQGGNVLERLVHLWAVLAEADMWSALVAIVTIVVAFGVLRLSKALPSFLIALVAGSGVAWVFGLFGHAVEMIDPVESVVPQFKMPATSIGDMVALAPGAAAIALVGLLEAISIGRTFALRRREAFDANQEMVGQGLSNAIGGFFQCYAGSGSFTRSGVNSETGACTPLSGVFAAGFLLAILLIAGQYIIYIPTPAMAGVIIVVAWRLINLDEFRHVITTSKSETVVLGLTLAAGLLIELDFAIYVGVITSLAVFIYESAHPSVLVSAPVVAESGRRKFRNADLHNLPQCPQVLTVRLDGPLYFGSVNHVASEMANIRRRRPDQTRVLLYLQGAGKVDLAGADYLIWLIRDLKRVGGSLRIVGIFPPLLRSLRRFHVIEELGEDNLHVSKGAALAEMLQEVDVDICRDCKLKVFVECSDLAAGYAAVKSSLEKENRELAADGVKLRSEPTG